MSLEQKIAELMEQAKELDIKKSAEENLDAMSDDINDLVENKEDLDQTIDLSGLFEGEELSEEFKTNVTSVFEAVVEARVKQEVAHIQEELESSLQAKEEELMEGLVEKVDGYLNYVVEQWVQENEIALERGIKLDIFESFISGMKDLLESHYIDAPDEKIDLMEELDSRATKLEEKYDAACAEIVGLRSALKNVAKDTQIREACEGLSDLEAAKFMQLAEELAYDDGDSFVKKLSIIKENLVKTHKQKPILDSVVTDSPVELLEEKQLDPTMARYLKAIR